jgi:hypothetical protein
MSSSSPRVIPALLWDCSCGRVVVDAVAARELIGFARLVVVVGRVGRVGLE